MDMLYNSNFSIHRDRFATPLRPFPRECRAKPEGLSVSGSQEHSRSVEDGSPNSGISLQSVLPQRLADGNHLLPPGAREKGVRRAAPTKGKTGSGKSQCPLTLKNAQFCTQL